MAGMQLPARGSFGLSPLFGNMFDRRYRLCGVETKNSCKFNKFDHIDATLAAFQPRYKRLVFAQGFGKLRLSKARRFALGNQHRNQSLVLFRSKRLRHFMPRFDPTGTSIKSENQLS